MLRVDSPVYSLKFICLNGAVHGPVTRLAAQFQLSVYCRNQIGLNWDVNLTSEEQAHFCAIITHRNIETESGNEKRDINIFVKLIKLQ